MCYDCFDEGPRCRVASLLVSKTNGTFSNAESKAFFYMTVLREGGSRCQPNILLQRKVAKQIPCAGSSMPTLMPTTRWGYFELLSFFLFLPFVLCSVVFLFPSSVFTFSFF